jgi:hypothetical protein
VSNIFYSTNAQETFVWVDRETVFPEAGKYPFEVRKEFFLCGAIYEHVVQVDFAYCPEESVEDTLNHLHEVTASPLGAHWEPTPFIQAERSDERREEATLLVDRHLVIA